MMLVLKIWQSQIVLLPPAKVGQDIFWVSFYRQACSWEDSSRELFLSWLLVQHSPSKRSNSIAVLARLTLSWPQSAATVTLWLLAFLIARDKLSHQTGGDSNTLLQFCLPSPRSVAMSVRIISHEQIRWAGWCCCVSQQFINMNLFMPLSPPSTRSVLPEAPLS